MQLPLKWPVKKYFFADQLLEAEEPHWIKVLDLFQACVDMTINKRPFFYIASYNFTNQY